MWPWRARSHLMDTVIGEAFGLHILSWPEAVLRMLLAASLAALLGIERDSKKKPIGFRAFAIIAMASCVLAILSQELYADFAEADNVISLDLSKIIAGVLTGIGFLGAGAIIKQNDGVVIGTATGASIRASGILGLTIGFGFYGLALAMFLMIGVILVAGSFLAGVLRKAYGAD